ncbi:uncharacterized protein LOC7485507 isoform X3 [Populus trichocarpa]|uniref:uncharacterized protein LOC7485507 isoform X3 n=1 Tax=Populus trichocarpa TaxID=3694 RepID=UPI000D18B23E|nr:uncharacterized protein LOC7485507 isoform X3 [Populus trichocarpa]|eukprot:XP_024459133.1 uncharacterized protein LOC7485507 isoform X3 [Populus trichocarpa]
MLFLLLHVDKESRIDDRTREIRSKDEKIRQMEMIIHEKSKSIDSLMSEIESLQPKGVIDVKEQSSKSYARIGELEKQVDKLRKELESQSQEKDSVEIRAYVAEKKYKELSLKLETVQVHGEWFPHWLTVYFSNFQYHVVTHWDEHGRQALDMTVQKVLEKKSQFDKWAEHHTETIYNKWIPMFKDWLLNCISYLWECIPPQTTKCDELFHAWKKTALHHAINRKWIPMFKDWSLNCISYLWECIPPQTTKCDELFHAWKKTALHHAINVQEMAGPYLKEARKFTQPCINQVAKMTRSLVKRVVAAIRTMIGLMVKWW